MTRKIEIRDTLNGVDPAHWNEIAGNNPFVSHAFLSALEETGCTGEEAGWLPCHVLLYDGGGCQ